MDKISCVIDRIRAFNAEVGSLEFSRLSGVPYTTIRSLARNDFKSKPMQTLELLAAAIARASVNRIITGTASLAGDEEALPVADAAKPEATGEASANSSVEDRVSADDMAGTIAGAA